MVRIDRSDIKGEIWSDFGSDIGVVFWIVIGIDVVNDMEDETGSDIVTITGGR